MDHSAWADNIFVATVQAYQVADYFLINDLKSGLAHKLKAEGLKVISVFQRGFAEENQDDACRAICGKSVPGLLEDFSTAVRELYSAIYPRNDHVRGIHVEFGVRTQFTALQHPEYVRMIREVPAFAADVLLASHRSPSASGPVPQNTLCDACGEAVFEEDNHIARAYADEHVVQYICAHCFGDWEFPGSYK